MSLSWISVTPLNMFWFCCRCFDAPFDFAFRLGNENFQGKVRPISRVAPAKARLSSTFFF